MKAMILAAGFGTRLRPHTNLLPKPLFTLNRVPVLEHHVKNLAEAGCSKIIINTHHLHEKIRAAVRNMPYSEKILLSHEPQILDTGGAISNVRPHLGDSDFFVINADVFCDLDLLQLWDFHQRNDALGTLVLCNDSRFNKVGVDADGWITDFESKNKGMTFTGIQVLSPEIFDFFPPESVFSSIDVYRKLCRQKKIKAFVKPDMFWSDIGTSQDYQDASIRLLCCGYFNLPLSHIDHIDISHLAGDGSDRKWYRARFKEESVVISDHGICLENTESACQLNAFIKIGDHLKQSEIHVPKIQSYDTISGIVIVEDLGDTHLQAVVESLDDPVEIQRIYQNVIDQLIDFSKKGIQGFDPAWTCQTQAYTKEMILQYECRYFIEAFVQKFLKLDISFDAYRSEFEIIAQKASGSSPKGLMHRDFQSRNIMIKDKTIYFIDFQSARKGPIQYDLASLLIDPYVRLPKAIQKNLLAYTIEKLNIGPTDKKAFKQGYNYCCVTRNLQFLGAFSFLSRIKGKKQFERFIPDAVDSLNELINKIEHQKIPKLKALVSKIKGDFKHGSHLCDG